MYTVYIIRSRIDRRYYTGVTENIERRLAQHNSGSVRSTKAYAPYQLIRTEEYNTKTEARQHENQLKRAGHLERHDQTRGPIV